MPNLLDTLASYVPALITRRLAADPAPLTAPLGERFPAAVLFADITGFTPLTERLGQRGLVGAEELSRILKDYFGPLTQLIHAHGGDVVKFAGDALLAVWKDEGREMKDEDTGAGNSSFSLHPSTLLRAAQCALEIQAKLHNYPAADGVRLSLRVGIGAGEMSVAHIGGVFGRWEFVLSGPAIAQVSLAEKQAQPGGVILSPEAWALAQATCEGEAGREGGWRLKNIRDAMPPRAIVFSELSPEAEPALRAYLPGAILARLAAGQSGWMAELRRVTVLFINLPGFGQATTLDESHEVMRELQRAIYRYEGSINKLNVDDKGVTLVAALGLPPLAHEDDPARGVLVALNVHATLTRLKRPHAIGVTTGKVFCGSVGGERRREYAIHADSVNLAARLMQAAALDLRGLRRSEGTHDPAGLNPILCDDATYQATQTRIEFETLPAITVKGKSAPVPVYRPLSEKKTIVRTPTEIIGRAQERAILTEAMQTLLRGDTAGVVVVEGEPGIGKSRLVDDVRRQAHELGLVTLSGAGDAVETKSAYHGWRGVFAELFGLESIPDAEARRQRVMQSLEPEQRELAPLLNEVLPLDLPPTALTQPMMGEVRADNTRHLLVTLLQAAVTQAPKVVILEDTHWLDSASWALALNVSQWVHPILLVVATRPMPEPALPEYAKLLAQPNTTRLQLQPLPDDDALTLVCRRLGVADLPDAVAALIREKAEGNPFYSEELAYALRDSGLIQLTGDECRVTPGVDLKTAMFPDTVQGVITGRIDRLSPPQQLAIKVASVIGRVFAVSTLHDIYPIEADKPQLRDYVAKLETLDLTPLDTPEPDLTYIFKHIITQEVAYNLMLFAQRRDLHRATAEWYERAHADDLSLYYPLLAHHWSKAEDRANALTYLEKAGEQALANYANQEAVSFLSEAARLADGVQPPVLAVRRARWERQMSEACLKLGRHSESREHSQRVLALLGRPLPARRGGRVISLLAQLAAQMARRLRPSATRAKADPPESIASRLEIARVYFILGELAYYDTDVVLGLGLMLGIVNLIEADGPSTELANAYAGLSLVGAHLGQVGLVRLYSRLAQASAQRVEKVETQAFVLQVISAAQLRLGHWAECESTANQSAAIYVRLGDRRRWEECLNYLAEVCAVRGDFARWAELLLEAFASARQRGDIQSALLVLVELVSVRLALSQTAQALADSQTVFNLLKQEPHLDFERLACARLAQVHLQRGDLPLATQALERGFHVTDEPSPALIFAVGSAALASAALDVWQAHGQPLAERQPLAQLLKKLDANARHDSRWIAQPLLWRLRGWEAWLSGNIPHARRLWRKSLAEAERLRIPYEAALAHYEIGRHTGGDERQQHLTHATEIFERLGATYDLERARAAVDKEIRHA